MSGMNSMTDYLNFDDILQPPSSPYDPDLSLFPDLPASQAQSQSQSQSQPNLHPSFPYAQNATATASTSTTSTPWTPPALSYTHSPVSELEASPLIQFDQYGLGLDHTSGSGFSLQKETNKGFDHEDSYAFSIMDPGMNTESESGLGAGVGVKIEPDLPLSAFSQSGPGDSTTIAATTSTMGRTYRSPFLKNLDDSPMLNTGGTVNTADLFGSVTGGIGLDGSEAYMNQFDGIGEYGGKEVSFGGGAFGSDGLLFNRFERRMEAGVESKSLQEQQQDLRDEEEEEEEGMDSPGSASAASPEPEPEREQETSEDEIKSKKPLARDVKGKAKSNKPSIHTQGRKPSAASASAHIGAAAVDDISSELAHEEDGREKRNVSFSEDGMDSLPLPAMFGGVKGKGGKKGGGMSSVVLEDGEEAGEEDDWRPSAEEYKKMSSKEKRQLRNKLSARAFRNRRKTYINELEDHIKDRDRLIDAIRNELKNFRSENDDLRREIGMLKKAALEPTEMMTPALSPTRTGSVSSASTSTTASTSMRNNATAGPSVNTFNPRKDLPASTSALLNQMSPRSMWGMGEGGGYTSVHTTFMPDISLPASYENYNTKSSASPPLVSIAIPRQNLNPHLNNGGNASLSPPARYQTLEGGHANMSDSFDTWASETPFSYRSLDDYRMQLWSRMARDASLAKKGVPLDMRPKFLKDPSELEKKINPKATEEQMSSNLVSRSVQPVESAAPVMSNVISKAISNRLYAAFLSAFQSPLIRALEDDQRTAGVEAPFTHVTSASARPNRAALPSADAEADAALAASFAHLKVATDSLGISLSGMKQDLKYEEEAAARNWTFLSLPALRS